MGEVLNFDEFRDRMALQSGISLEVVPPVIIVRYMENGTLREHQLISERMLRDLLDELNA